MVRRREHSAWRQAFAGAAVMVPAVVVPAMCAAADEAPQPVQIQAQVEQEAKEAAKKAAEAQNQGRQVVFQGGNVIKVQVAPGVNPGIPIQIQAIPGIAVQAVPVVPAVPVDAEKIQEEVQAKLRKMQQDLDARVKQRNAAGGVFGGAGGGGVGGMGGIVRGGRHFMLGVVTSPVSPALRSQLKLAEGEGLVVEHVLPNSPAAKAGLKQYDVVTKINGASAKSPADLVRIVGESAEKNVKMELVREGKPEAVEVKPEERKEEAGVQGRVFNVEVPDGVRGAVITAEGDVLIHRMLPMGAAAAEPLPKGVAIQVSRDGDKPAKVVVTLDGKTYEATEDKLDQLPESVRPHVARFFAPAQVFTGRAVPRGGFGGVPAAQAVPFGGGLVPAPAAGVDPSVIQQLKQEVQAMRKALEDLQKEVEKNND